MNGRTDKGGPGERPAEPLPAETTAGEIERTSAELERLTREAEGLASELDREAAAAGTSVPALRAGGSSPAEMKARMARLRKAAVGKQEELAAKSRELRALMEARLAEANARSSRLEKMAARLEEGVRSIGLYLGRDEEIFTLREGQPAPASAPITVRQLVLAMDQECAVAAEEGGIDAVDQERFDEWLLEDPAHLEQVLPEEKGVVALVPRFDAKDYDDPWKTTAVAEANKQTYFLIRNGERLYWTWTDFRAGKRLVLARDELASFFEEERYEWAGPGEPSRRVKRPIQPGTLAWERAEERAGARTRHYMRVALVLQGLLDRTTVFHPIPDEGVSFLDSHHHATGRVRFVLDADPALTAAGHEPFRVWQRRLNTELRPGLRVVGNFRGTDWFHANDFLHMRKPRPGHSRLHPHAASAPPTGVPLPIEERSKGTRYGEPDTDGLVLRYEREDDVKDPDAWREDPERPGWGWRGEWRKAKTRASCTVYPDDPFLIPFDLAGVEEMERYLRSRTERHEYLTMFPVLKAAITAKKREAEEEEPFRLMLAGVLARENGVHVAEAEGAVPDLVAWWKVANRRHRPLVVGEAGEDENAKAVRAIVAEHRRRLGDAERFATDDPAVTEALGGRHADALLVARKRDGRYVVLVPERAEGEPDANVFCAEWEYTGKGAREGRPAKGFPKRWRLVGTRPEKGSWGVLWASGRWERWDRGASASEHLSDPEREEEAAAIVAEHKAGEKGGCESGLEAGRLLAVAYVPRDRCFGVWRLLHGATVHEDRLLTARHTKPGVSYRVRPWRRTTGGRVRLLQEVGTIGIPVWKGGRPPGVILFEDAEALAEKAREERRHGEAEERQRALDSRASRALRSIEEAWLENAEREAYRRFMEDYADPERWEGHRETLAISYPYRTPYRQAGLDRLVKRLVEEGAELGGLSVAEAVALAEERSIRHDDFEVPDDLAPLRFPADGEAG